MLRRVGHFAEESTLKHVSSTIPQMHPQAPCSKSAQHRSPSCVHQFVVRVCVMTNVQMCSNAAPHRSRFCVHQLFVVHVCRCACVCACVCVMTNVQMCTLFLLLLLMCAYVLLLRLLLMCTYVLLLLLLLMCTIVYFPPATAADVNL